MEMTGRPFGFLDLAWVGIPVTLAGLVWLVAAAPHLLKGRGLQNISQGPSRSRPFFTELRVTSGSPLAGLPASKVASELRGTIYSHLRDDRHVFGSPRHQLVFPGDILLVEADSSAITEASDLGRAEVVIADRPQAPAAWVEAVVLPQSMIIGSTAGTIEAFLSRGIQIVAIGTHLQRIEGRLADLQVRVGDVLLLYGQPEAIARGLEEVDCLPLSPHTSVPITDEGWQCLLAFVAAVALAATNLVPPEISFGVAVIALSSIGALDLRSAIAELNWPILLMLAAMIPLGDAVATTGLADLIARNAVLLIGSSDPLALTATVLLSAVAITPFVNNVSAAIALGPIAAALAKTAGFDPEPFLIAVAVGVSLDFLTPFGHHNNALAMSIGTHRFADFARLGLPLTLGATILAVLAIRLAYL
jgi:di/tricarboxylate transporter